MFVYGGFMTLENKLGISDQTELAREEERLSKMRARELFEKGILSTYSKMHSQPRSMIKKYL